MNKWTFPKDDSGQNEGFNHPGIEHFEGSPMISLARESVQNSIDAIDDKEKPVRVSFDYREVNQTEIPSAAQLQKAIATCSRHSKKQGLNNAKETQFFKNAVKSMQPDTMIPILQVSDYNTTGMKGPCEEGNPYYDFMKSTGTSNKNTDTPSLGSFGIGKFAPYAVSNLRTVFVSTVYSNQNKLMQLTQGKSILISHTVQEDGETIRFRSTGFWGNESLCMPVEGISEDCPDWIQRCHSESDLNPENKGSTLTIIGFKKDDCDDWELALAVSIAENFFAAIYHGKLEVSIGDNYELTANSICDFFANNELIEKIGDEKGFDNEPKTFSLRSKYLNTLLSPESVDGLIVKTDRLNYLGNVEMRLMIQEGLGNSVAVIRDGMFITDELPGLKRLSGYKEFIVTIRCLEEEGNILLKDMEPVKHDRFDFKRLPSQKQHQGRLALQDLKEWIKSVLNEYAKEKVEETSTIDELSEYLGGYEGVGGDLDGDEINPLGGITYGEKKQKLRPLPLDPMPGGEEGNEEGDEGGGERGDGKKPMGEGPGSYGSGEGSGPNKGDFKNQVVPLTNIRSPINKKSSDGKRIIAFTSEISGMISISVFKSGADVDEKLSIIESETGKVAEDGVIQLKVKKGDRNALLVRLASNYKGSVKVVAHEV